MDRLSEYLSASYRRDILGESVNAEAVLADDTTLIAEIKAKLAQIAAIRSPNLAARDFVSYQNKRALERALKRLEDKANAPGE